MRRLVLILPAFLLAVAADPPATERKKPAPVTAPTAADLRRRVVIVSIDGLRPDLLLRARMPNARALMARGSYTFWARTVDEAYTLPSHVSMVTGVTPQRHGVTWNGHTEEAYPQVPTIFTLARRAGRTTALATGKAKFVALTPPDSLDWRFQPTAEPIPDAEVAARAAEMIREHRPNLLFVHFPGADNAGHAYGWGSRPQMEAIEQIDHALGVVLAAADEDPEARESTLVILTADHGGAGGTHGPDDPRSRHIPWIAAGPRVRRDYDLTLAGGPAVRTEDTFATACAYLRIVPRHGVDGRTVSAMYEPPAELLHPIGRR